MNYRIILDASFKKEVKRLAKKYPSLKKDLSALQDELLSNPQAGIDLGGGLRKVRMAIASKGRGDKSIFQVCFRKSLGTQVQELE